MAVVLLLLLVIAAPSFAQTAEGYRQQAIEESRHKSWDEAIANYQKALSLNPNDALTHYDLALALKYKGDPRQAAEEFKKSIELRPKWADPHYGLGAVLYDLHDLPAASKELQATVNIDPANAGAYRLLARIYSEQNNFAAAERELTRTVEQKPSPEAYVELGAGQRPTRQSRRRSSRISQSSCTQSSL